MSLDNHALYAVGIAVSLAVLDRLRHRFWIFAILAMPGTAAHEAAHYLAALLTGGKPCSLSIIPRRVEGGYILGTVQFRRPRWWNVPIIALAPLALVALAYWAYVGLVAAPSIPLWRVALGLFVTGSLAWGALPSGQDLSLIWKFSKPAFILAPALAVGVWVIASPGVVSDMATSAKLALASLGNREEAKPTLPQKPVKAQPQEKRSRAGSSAAAKAARSN